MADAERSVDEWRTLLGSMFPKGVRVTATGDNTPQYTARPIRVFEDPDSNSVVWILGISESHGEYLSLAGATVQPDGTLKVEAYGTTAIVRATDEV